MGWVLLVMFVVIVVAAPMIAHRRRKPLDQAALGSVPGHIANLPSGDTYYQWRGPKDGAIAVCIHGLTTPSYVWDVTCQGLTRMGYRVLTYDLYGRGYSDRPTGKQDTEFFIRQLDELLEDQGVDGGIMLLGYSMGAAIATSYCAKQPNMLERMILLAPAGFGLTPNRLEKYIIKTPLIGDWVMMVFGGWILRRRFRSEAKMSSEMPEIYTRQIQETSTQGYLPAVLSSMRHIMSETLEDQHRIIAASNIPVAAIWGGADTMIPISGIGKLTEINRTAYQTMIPDAPHSMLYTYQNEVHKALQEFLREV